MSSFYSEGSTWVSMGGGTTAVADAPATVQNTEQADNSTPLGRGIPKGVGVFPAKGEIVIDPDTLGGVRVVRDRLVVNLVLNFADTDLGGTASLVWLKANDEYIYRAETPQRQPTSPLRIYGGDQTAVDPLITEYMAAEYRTFWPGMAYVVLEDFDITGYDSQIPTFTAAWSTDATAIDPTETYVTWTFGDYGANDEVLGSWTDWQRGLQYRVVHVYNTRYEVSTVRVQDGVEINRVPITGQPITYLASNRYNCLSVCQGTNYGVMAVLHGDATPSTAYSYDLIDLTTGKIEARLDPIVSGSTWTDAYFPLEPILLSNDAATLFAVFARGRTQGSHLDVCASDCLLVDTTNKTIEFLHTRLGSPIRPRDTATEGTGYSSRITSNIPVRRRDGEIRIYWSQNAGGNTSYVFTALLGKDGVSEVDALCTINVQQGLAYDAVSDKVLINEYSNKQFVVVDALTGAVQYTKTNLELVGTNNAFLSMDTSGHNNEMRPGYAYFRDNQISSSSGEYQWLIYIPTGETFNILDYNIELGGVGGFGYDQYRNTFYRWDIDPDFYALYNAFITVGDLTPNAVDASDVLTKLETYFGDYVSGDLNFVNFTGSECKGYLVDQDTTIDACIRDVCETLGLREVHDNGKVNFVVPARDGSYSLEAALTDADITIDPIRQTIADEDKAFERVTLDYIDADNSYERASQEVARPNGTYTVLQSNKRFGASTGLCLTAAQAAKAAWRMMIESDFERKTYEFGVMPKKLTVQPTATVSFTYGPDDDFTVIGEVREASISADFTQALRVNEFMAAIDSTVIGSSLVTVAPSYANATAEFVLLDTALLSYGDDAGGSGLRGYGVLIGAGEANIDASSAWRSSDGTTYTLISTRTGISPIAGVISDTITRNYSDGFQTDYDAQLVVTVSSGDVATLADCTEGQRYRNENYAAIGAQGRWVLISWSDVTVSGQVATFSEIIWGVNGTEVYLSSLAQGDRFINLETAEVVRFLNGSATLDSIIYYKGGYNGFLISALPTIAAMADGEAEKPYAPVGLAYSDAGSTRTITWEYRERKSVMPVLYGSESAGYSETSLAFEIDLLDGSGAVLTTLTATGGNTSYNTGTYTATSAKVYQMGLSGTLRGHAATLTF